MPDDDDRAFLASAIGGGGVIGERLPFRIIVYGRVDAVVLNFLSKGIHTERENVHKAAQKVHVCARLRRARPSTKADDYQDKEDAKRKSPQVSHSAQSSTLREAKKPRSFRRDRG